MQLKNPLHTKPWIIAGPCSAESQEQVIATANRLKIRFTYLELESGSLEPNLIHLKELEKKL